MICLFSPHLYLQYLLQFFNFYFLFSFMNNIQQRALHIQCSPSCRFIVFFFCHFFSHNSFFFCLSMLQDIYFSTISFSWSLFFWSFMSETWLFAYLHSQDSFVIIAFHLIPKFCGSYHFWFLRRLILQI